MDTHPACMKKTLIALAALLAAVGLAAASPITFTYTTPADIDHLGTTQNTKSTKFAS